MEWSSGMDWGTSYPSALEDVMQVDAHQNRVNFQASKSNLHHEKPYMADRQMKTRRTARDSAPYEKPLLLAPQAPPSLPPQHYSRPAGLIIDTQPPECVRTRTATENRTFGTIVSLCEGSDDVVAVEVSLLYAGNYEGSDAVPAATILGGTKRVPVAAGKGEVVFDQLSLNEASTKHGEREFCLEFHLVHSNGTTTNTNCRTNGFYAFTHKKVLARRRNVALRALGKDSGPLTGGVEMVVVGAPFVKGPSLAVAITTPHGTMNLRFADGGVELFSDSVLIFRLPPYPRRMGEVLPTSDVQAVITVTNDGRAHSNRLPFVYKASPLPLAESFGQLSLPQQLSTPMPAQPGHSSKLSAPHQAQQLMPGTSWRDNSWGNATSFTEQMFS